MNAFVNAILLLLLSGLVYLVVRLSVQRKLLAQLQEDQRALAEFRCTEEASFCQLCGSKSNPFITIEILNAVELATKASKVGGLIGKCAPGLMHRIVIRRTANTMRNQMTEHGVQVVVKVHSPG